MLRARYMTNRIVPRQIQSPAVRWPMRMLLVLALFPVSAHAVTTSHWIQSSEKDWKAGKFKNVVATNLGDVKLSRQVQTLLEQDSRISSVYCMAEAPDGTIYAGTGPQGVLLAIRGSKITTAATVDKNETIFSVAIEKNGRVLMGTGGDKGQIFELLDDGKTKSIFSHEGVQYIWALAITPDGNLYAATGPQGQLFEIKPDGSHSVLFDSHESNLLSLLSDGKDILYAGSDPDGRVYRINRKTKESFVLYEAGESEITSLALDRAGNLYAATGQADQAAQPGQPAEIPAAAGQGRPEAAPGGVQIPSAPPANPAPPTLPEPNPGEPRPIPKTGPVDTSPDAPKMSIQPTDDSPPAKTTPPPEATPKAPPAPKNPTPSKNEQASESTPVENIGNTVAPGAKGNAIYRIDPQGFVTEVFREPVIVFSMIEQNGKLLVATGSDGTIYQVDPAAQETLALAKVDAKDVMCLLPARDGRTYIGLANVGGLAAMPARLASQGTYTSAVLDAIQVSRFGKMQMRGILPTGTSLKVSTHTGNVETPDGAGWSKWTEALPATQYFQIKSPNARFLQYRLFFGSDDAGKFTPVVRHIDVAYQLPNLAPQVRAVRISISSKQTDAQTAADATAATYKPGRGLLTAQWDASDPNNDPLLYSVYYRMGAVGKWILIKDKLTDTQLDWDTRTVQDGQYVLKVQASDAAANPIGEGKIGTRISDPIFVDNTPPVIGDLTWQKEPAGIKMKFRVVDASSEIAGVEYSLDSSQDWQAVLPVDKIFDSPAESVELSINQLSSGPHQLTIRATDDHGNRAYQSVRVSGE